MPEPKLSERAFQAQVIDYARLRGWRVWHIADARRQAGTRWVGDTGVAGLPDLILIRPPRLVFAELKSARGRVRPAQQDVLDLLAQCGCEVYLWRPSDWQQIQEVLR